MYIEEDEWNLTVSTYNSTVLRVTWSVPIEYNTSNTTVTMLASVLDDDRRARRKRAPHLKRDVPVLQLTRATEEQATIGGLQLFTVYKIDVTVSHPNGTELYSREVYGVSGETCKLTVVRTVFKSLL